MSCTALTQTAHIRGIRLNTEPAPPLVRVPIVAPGGQRPTSVTVIARRVDGWATGNLAISRVAGPTTIALPGSPSIANPTSPEIAGSVTITDLDGADELAIESSVAEAGTVNIDLAITTPIR